MLMKDLCKDYFWIMPKTPKYTEAASIPYITSKNLKEGYINYSNCKYITKETFKKLTSKRYIQEDDFLISMIGTIGEVGIVKKSDLPIYGQNMYLLRPDFTKVNKRYLYHFLSSSYLKNKLLSIINGATQGYLHDKDIIDQPIKLYDLRVQNFIADELDLINNAIKLKQNELLSLDKIIKSRFIDMFGSINNTQFEVKKINDLCEFVKDGTHQTPKYTEDKVNGFKFLSSKDVTTGKINWSNIKYIPAELHDKLYKTIAPRRNDILLAKNGTTGIAALVETDEIFDIYVSLAILRFKEYYNSKFMLYAINNDDTKKQFDKKLKGVGVPNLHLGEIKETKIIIPSIDLQNEFVIFAEQIDKLKFIVQEQIKNLQELFDKKMDEYFGE